MAHVNMRPLEPRRPTSRLLPASTFWSSSRMNTPTKRRHAGARISCGEIVPVPPLAAVRPAPDSSRSSGLTVRGRRPSFALSTELRVACRLDEGGRRCGQWRAPRARFQRNQQVHSHDALERKQSSQQRKSQHKCAAWFCWPSCGCASIRPLSMQLYCGLSVAHAHRSEFLLMPPEILGRIATRGL